MNDANNHPILFILKRVQWQLGSLQCSRSRCSYLKFLKSPVLIIILIIMEILEEESSGLEGSGLEQENVLLLGKMEGFISFVSAKVLNCYKCLESWILTPPMSRHLRMRIKWSLPSRHKQCTSLDIDLIFIICSIWVDWCKKTWRRFSVPSNSYIFHPLHHILNSGDCLCQQTNVKQTFYSYSLPACGYIIKVICIDTKLEKAQQSPRLFIPGQETVLIQPCWNNNCGVSNFTTDG